jgi:hypothetical protein
MTYGYARVSMDVESVGAQMKQVHAGQISAHYKLSQRRIFG